MNPDKNVRQVFTKDGILYTVTVNNKIVTAEKVVDETLEPKWEGSGKLARDYLSNLMRK